MFSKEFFKSYLDKFNTRLASISDVDILEISDFDRADIFQDEANTDTTVCCVCGVMLFARQVIENEVYIWAVIDDENGESFKSEVILI